jgi:hypothetical protein
VTRSSSFTFRRIPGRFSISSNARTMEWCNTISPQYPSWNNNYHTCIMHSLYIYIYIRPWAPQPRTLTIPQTTSFSRTHFCSKRSRTWLLDQWGKHVSLVPGCVYGDTVGGEENASVHI